MITSYLIEQIQNELGLKNPISKRVIHEALEAIKVFDDKHTEKGLASYSDFGPIGVAVKLSDKFEPLKEHYITDESLPGELVEELWQDVAVYGIIGKLVEKGEWD